jgi:hypothetical protein
MNSGDHQARANLDSAALAERGCARLVIDLGNRARKPTPLSQGRPRLSAMLPLTPVRR